MDVVALVHDGYACANWTSPAFVGGASKEMAEVWLRGEKHHWGADVPARWLFLGP